jgi:EpsI family protein
MTKTSHSSSLCINKQGLWIACILLSAFTLSFSGLILTDTSNSSSEERITLENFPESFGDWKAGEPLGLDIRSLDVLQLSSYVKRVYTNSEGKHIFLYIGYWASQSGEHQAAKHSPVLCLPSNGWLTSTRDNHTHTFMHEGNKISIDMRRLVGEKRGNASLFYYWFFTGEEYYNQEWYALIKLSLQNLFYGRNDGGIVEIVSDISRTKSKEEAEVESNELIQNFISELTPYLHERITESVGTY